MTPMMSSWRTGVMELAVQKMKAMENTRIAAEWFIDMQ